jgi:hypothetical protein
VAVPSTAIALLLFLTLLVPGFIASLISERHRAQQQRSPFRETVSIVCISVAADIAALLIFAVIRIAWPGITPDVGALIRHPSSYVSQHYAVLAWWSLAALAVAVALASVSASATARRGLAKIPLIRNVVPTMHPSSVSGWWLLFTEHPDARMHVGCTLDDGSYVAGWLNSYSNVADDSADRDLLLAGPIRYRVSGGEEEKILRNVGAISVSARHIILLTVSYLDEANAARADQRDMTSTAPTSSRWRKIKHES